MSLIDIDTNSLTNLPRIFMPYTNNPQQQQQKQQQQSVNFSYRANDNASCSGLTTDFPQLVSYGLTQQQQAFSLTTMSGQPTPNGATNVSNGGSNGQQQIQQHQTAFNSSSALTNYSYNPSLLNMDDKAFDITVFDILKVDPDDIAVSQGRDLNIQNLMIKISFHLPNNCRFKTMTKCCLANFLIVKM